MCKIAGTTGFNPQDLQEIINDTWSEMSATETDGYGAAWTDTKGGVSWVKTSIPFFPEEEGLYPDFCSAFGDSNINGEPDGNYLIIHGRTATCSVETKNTHPMIEIGKRRQMALVHNGMVDSFTYDNVNSTCDSELLLRAYQKDGFKGIEDGVEGYYALMMIDRTKARTQFIVARDDRAMLQVGKMDSGHWCFATTRELIETMGADPFCKYKASTYAVFTLGKDKPHVKRFVSIPKTWTNTSKAFGGYSGSYSGGYGGGSINDEESEYWRAAEERYGSEKSTTYTPSKHVPRSPHTPTKPHSVGTNKPAGIWASGQKRSPNSHVRPGPVPKSISNVADLDKELEARKKADEANAKLLLGKGGDKE